MALGYERLYRRLAAHEAPSPRQPITSVQRRRYESHLAEILSAFGMRLDTPGTRNTPARMLGALWDATCGYEGDDKLLTAFPAESRAGPARGQQVVEGPIAFYALCEHHVLPFFGRAWIGYVPDRELIGLSKLTRLVRLFARRFTFQERIGEQVAAELTRLVGAAGVAVRLEAEHLCTQMRGVAEPGVRTASTTWRGCYEHNAMLRTEFNALCAGPAR
jgi:GTP cyclohydrolase I